ncbi:hypothetical protein BDL97_09G088900 [Sphagnum fallax]|nr:hypothetical protein BDL97_09G088900 [Sphagnum fallax]KAH8952508.1 hypothetical protein BDL97_09G088900 [Sphagnum fallax]
MDRGREGRRSGAADRGGPVSAPRRPRTSGFKDAAAAAAVSDDCDDNTMDDGHNNNNARLRERPPKKNSIIISSSNGLMSGKAALVSTTSVVSLSRIKRRKRQGLHEIQVQVCGAIAADESEDVTHDLDMVGSEEEDDDDDDDDDEDDDDLPPPPIPRRPPKSRSQVKGVEDFSIRNDLPTVPRKARSAVPKRAHESLPPPPVVETPSHPPPPVASPTPAPSSTLSLSSAVTLKPRRRMKPSGPKPKASKLFKVSPPTVSEEVEVAEALFDLARLTPHPSVFNRRMDLKPEFKPEAKSLASGSVQLISRSAQPSNGTAPPSHILAPNTVSTELSSPSPAAASPVASSSPSSVVAPPLAEAPKKKRPRIRTHPDEGAQLQAGLITSTPIAVSSSHGLAAPQSKEIDQSEVCLVAEDHPVGVVDEDSVKIEPTTSATMTNLGPASSSPIGAPVLPVPAASTQHDSSVEQENEKLEKKMANGEVTRTISDENKSASVLPIDKKPAALKLDSPTTGIQDVDAATTTSPVPSDAATEVDIAKRSVQPAPAGEGAQVKKLDIDLMAPPSKPALGSLSERSNNVAEMPVEEGPENPLGDSSVISPVANGWIEKESSEKRQETQQLEREETETEMPKEQESEDRERTDLTKLPLPQASEGVKPELRPQKSEKTSASVGTTVAGSLLASTAASPISPGMPGWPGVMPSLGYFTSAAAAAAAAAALAAAWPAAAVTGASSVDENPLPRVSPFLRLPPQQPWKRCASHVRIAHFIDTQQQVNRHHFFSTGLYGGKSYNANLSNMSLPPPDALCGNSGAGGTQVAAVASPPRSSGIALGAGLGVGHQGLGATTIPGTKEREKERIAGPTFMEGLNWSLAPQQQQPTLCLQAGAAFGFSGAQAGTIMMVSSNNSSTGVNGVVSGALNTGNPTLPGSTSSPRTSSLMARNSGPPGAGSGSGANNQVAASAPSVQEQNFHAMMQNPGFSYHQYPGPHFGPPSFSSSPALMGTQQVAAQYFAGSPFFGQHLLSPSQQPVHHTSVVANGGSVPLQKQQQQQQGLHRFPPAGSPQPQQPPPQSPSHSSSQQQQLQPQSDRDFQDGPSGGDSGSMAESKFPTLHRPPYSQGYPNTPVANVSIPPASVQSLPSHQDFSIFAALGKQNKQDHHHQQQQQQRHASVHQLQASQAQSSISSQMQQQQLQTNLKGLDAEASQAFSGMAMTATMNRGPVGPGPLGLAPVAAVMAPQGHAMLQSMAEVVHSHPPQSPHHSSGSSAHPSLSQQQQLQMHQLQYQQHQHQQQQHQQQRQHRSSQMQRGPQGVEEGRMVADANNYTTNTSRGQEQDPRDDRKMSSKRTIGLSSPMSRITLDSSPITGNTHYLAPAVNFANSTSAIMSTRPTGHSAEGGVPPPFAQASQAPKHSTVHSKGMTGQNTAISAAFTQSNMNIYVDCHPQVAPLTAKVSGPGLSIAGQTAIPAIQGARQTSTAQHTQSKLSHRTPISSMPTAPGADPKAVLAAAMAKVQSPQSQLQQSHLPQVAPHTGSASWASSAVSGPPASSSSTPFYPLPTGPQSSAAVGAKQGSYVKGSTAFPTSQKSVGPASGKRNSSSALSQHVILGPSTNLGNQNVSAKLPQQQTQNSHPMVQPQVPQQHVPSMQQQHQQPSQTHKQHDSQQQQMQMRQQPQLLPQQQTQMFQQLQHPQSQSQPLPSPPQQHPQQLQQQPQCSPPLIQPQPQQNPTNQQPAQQSNQQQQQQQLASSFSGSNANGSLLLTPAAISGQSNSGNIANSELSNPEQLNSIRPMQVPASVRIATSSSAAGPSPIPQPSSVQQTGSPIHEKSSNGQFSGSNDGDNMSSQSHVMKSVVPSSTISNLPNCLANNNISNGHIVSDVRPPLLSGSSAAVQQGTLNSNQVHPSSSLSMVAVGVVPTASAVEP